VHPQQQFGVVDAMDAPGVRVLDPQCLVYAAYLAAQLVGLLGGAPGHDAHEVGGALQPADRVLLEGGVLPDAAHRDRVQCLEHEAPYAADPHRPVDVDLPGDTLRWLHGRAHGDHRK
jgi:hypothetical protein